MNKEFADKITALKKGITDLLNSDMAKEQIDNLKGLSSQVDELSNLHNKTENDLTEIKDAYIQAVKNEGSKEAPKQDGGEPPQAKSFEELVLEAAAKN